MRRLMFNYKEQREAAGIYGHIGKVKVSTTEKHTESLKRPSAGEENPTI